MKRARTGSFAPGKRGAKVIKVKHVAASKKKPKRLNTYDSNGTTGGQLRCATDATASAFTGNRSDNTAGAPVHVLTQIPRAAGSHARAERSCTLKGIQIRGEVISTYGKGCAIALVYDRDHGQSALPTPNDFFLEMWSKDQIGPGNPDYAMRWKILRRWDFAQKDFPVVIDNVAQDSGTTAAGATTLSYQSNFIDEYIPIKDKELAFATNTGGIAGDYADCSIGSVYLVGLGNGVAASNSVDFYYSSRVYFSD